MTTKQTIKCEQTEVHSNDNQTIISQDISQKDKFENLKEAYNLIQFENKELKKVLNCGKSIINRVSAENDGSEHQLCLLNENSTLEKQMLKQQIENLNKEVFLRESEISRLNTCLNQIHKQCKDEKNNSQIMIDKLWNEQKEKVKQLNETNDKQRIEIYNYQIKIEKIEAKIKLEMTNQKD
jgi:hypothetical protein